MHEAKAPCSGLHGEEQQTQAQQQGALPCTAGRRLEIVAAQDLLGWRCDYITNLILALLVAGYTVGQRSGVQRSGRSSFVVWLAYTQA